MGQGRVHSTPLALPERACPHLGDCTRLSYSGERAGRRHWQGALGYWHGGMGYWPPSYQLPINSLSAPHQTAVCCKMARLATWHLRDSA